MSQACAAVSLESASSTTWDAVVVGAGPAGALAARQLALLGRRILLVEKKRFPRWKICGACLNGQALSALRSAGLGSLVARLGGIGLYEVRIGFRGRTARLALPEGASLSRSRLDMGLVEVATDAGAQFLPETQAVVGGIKDAARLIKLTHDGRSIEASGRVVLIATGLGSSSLAEPAAPTTQVKSGSRIGAGCVVAAAPGFYEVGTIFMAVGRDGYVGLVRMEDGSVNVAAALAPGLVRRWGTPGRAATAILAEAGLAPIDALEDAHWQGTAGLTRQTRPLAAERLFVLGDAASYVEPFTGEGIAWALASAQAVAPLARRALEQWDPRIGQHWCQLHRRGIGRRQVVCRAVAMALKRPWLASIAFEVLTRAPALAWPVMRRVNAPPSFTNAS
jgi:flavin-dependent dehydrogenase